MHDCDFKIFGFRLFGYSSKWKKEVVESLNTLVNSTEKISLGFNENLLKFKEITQNWDNFQKVLPELSETQTQTRKIVNNLALRKLNFEVCFSQSYFERWINKDNFSSAFSVIGPGFKIVAKTPIKVLFEMNANLPCERFGTDQFGCFIDAEVQAESQALPITIHFSVGSRFLNGKGQFFLARPVKITSQDTSLTKLEISSFEKLLSKRIDEELVKITLPQISLHNSDDSPFKFNQMSMQVTKHSSIYNSVKYDGKIEYPSKFQCFNPHENTPIFTVCSPIQQLNDGMEVGLRISPSVIIEMMKEELRKRTFELRATIYPIFSSIIDDPLDTNPNLTLRKKVIFLQGEGVCCNEFEDTEGYGVHRIYVNIEITQPSVGVTNVSLCVRGEGKLFAGFSFPQITILTLENISDIKPMINTDAIDIVWKYIS